MKTPRRLTCGFANVLDTVRTLDRTGEARIKPLNERITLNLNEVITRKMVVITLILSGTFGLIYANPASASSPNQINAYRVYAHERIFDFKQFTCFDHLIQRESHYNDRAINGNHYGLAQGMSKDLIKMSGYQQIDWSLSYIRNRYITPCRALHHSLVKGWY